LGGPPGIFVISSPSARVSASAEESHPLNSPALLATILNDGSLIVGSVGQNGVMGVLHADNPMLAPREPIKLRIHCGEVTSQRLTARNINQRPLPGRMR
jgi:hypothetical protein